MNADKIFTELKSALLTDEKPSDYLENLRNTAEFELYFPELKALIGVMQHSVHHREGDVWTHTLMVTDEAAKRRKFVENKLGFMLSALCHDFGKAVCSVEIDGIIHAYDHEKKGLPIIEKFLDRFNVADDLKKYVLNMAELHMKPNIMAKAQSKIRATNRLFDSSVEPFALIQLGICDSLGKLPSSSDSEEFLLERYRIFTELMSLPHVTADDLINAGIPRDSRLDKVLEYAHKLRLAGIERDSALVQSIAYWRKLR